jgi:hypothetical protein
MIELGLSMSPGGGSESIGPFFLFNSNTPGGALVEQGLELVGSPIQSGDTIYAYVDSDLNGDGTSDVYFLDENTGAYSYQPSLTVVADGSSAGCLVQTLPTDDPDGGLPLSDFGTMTMQCGVYEAGTAQMGPIGAYPNIPLDMVAGSNPGATTSALSSQLGFALTWMPGNPNLPPSN